MKVKGIIESDVDTFKVGDVIEVKLADGVKVQAMAARRGRHDFLSGRLPAWRAPDEQHQYQ